MKRKPRRIQPRADINATPFIDILLVLLVIFMTISPSVPTGLNTAIPQQPPPGPHKADPDVLILSINRSGVIRINQDEVEPSRLVARLQEIFKTRHDHTIFVQADNELLFNELERLSASVRTSPVLRAASYVMDATASPPVRRRWVRMRQYRSAASLKTTSMPSTAQRDGRRRVGDQ
jgi:biopolymer transport protein ExbD